MTVDKTIAARTTIKDHYFLSGDGYLVPARKGQLVPDPHYFKQTHN
jgi:hypothetical protein